MAILTSYNSLRVLANPGGTIAPDGLPEWPAVSMRAGGFDAGLDVSPTDSFPILVTCNALAADAVDDVDDFDWFVWQGAEGGGPFVVSPPSGLGTHSYSGTISLSLSSWAAAEYPDPFDVSTIEVLFFGVDILVRRRSDGAMQRIDIQAVIRDANEDKFDVG